ncbi:site-specific integrase [Shinella sp.]|uniref:tyrosine-type recombinase/integrase n=1 Tax=Shinella sp. TaxID=1870904 RepID=UPI002590EF48|nr:site-specific integrase [Shinella sp.]
MATIRKRTLPSGNSVWLAEYRDGSGKRRFKQFDRRKDADTFLLTVRGEVRDGIHVAASQSVTVSTAADDWLMAVKAAGRERSTYNQYRQHVDLHIRPLIGDVLLSKLSVPAARDFEDQLRAEGRSPAMTKKVMVSLGSLLADAQERGKVARNVVRERSRTGRKASDTRAERRQKGKLKVGVDIPTAKEIKAIVTAAEGRWRPLLLVAIFAGLRASELRGLRWADVNLDRAEIRVHQRADRFNDIGRPKSEAGERTVPIPPMVVSALTDWKAICPTGELDLVFPTGAGTVEQLANIRRRGLIPTMIAAGVTVDTGKKDDDGEPVLDAKYSGMHALRHFFASWCINRKEDGGLGLPLKVVQERLGHSSVTMTADVYGHLFPRADDLGELAEAERMLMA